MKTIFLKTPFRFLQIFWTIAANIPLLPELIFTRWGTWTNVGMYYCEHLYLIKRFVMELDEYGSISIKKVNDFMKDSNMECNLTFIKCYFWV